MSKLKQAILRAIAIKLEVETHKKYRKVMSKIFLLVFIGFLGFGLYNSIKQYRYASAILSNPQYLSASVEQLPSYNSHKLPTYHYSFSVKGVKYQKDITVTHKNFEKYGGENGIKVAYKSDNPSQFGIAYLIKENGSIGGIFKHFALMFFIGGLGFMVIYMFITNGVVQPKEAYEDDE